MPSTSEEISVAVIYLAFGRQDYDGYTRRFFDSYKKHPAGIKHNLVVAAKSYENNQMGYASLIELSKQNNAVVIDLPDDGMEFAAFYRTAKQYDCEYIFCFTSTSYILTDNWLNLFVSALEKNPNCRLLAPNGSWENPFPNILARILNYIKHNKIKNAALAGTDNSHSRIKKNNLGTLISKILQSVFYPLPFPNYHIRTSVFMINKALYMSYIEKYGFPQTREDAYAIEHGYNNISKFVKRRGFDFAVVGSNAEVYKPAYWDKSKTFRTPDLSNLIISDKQIDLYEKASPQERKWMELKTWGRYF